MIERGPRVASEVVSTRADFEGGGCGSRLLSHSPATGRRHCAALAVVCGAYAVGNFLTIAGVVYSALTTATAFGSSWFSSGPGASSMGKLVALSLACTLAAAVLFQPILRGKPRSPAPGA